MTTRMFEGRGDPFRVDAGAPPRDSREWIDSADFLAELHRRTGRNIVSDYYLRLYPRDDFACRNARLADALDRAAAAMKASWVPDGDYLRFRRVNYYAERELDVPNRLLKEWRDARARKGSLGLDELSEVASLPEVVLSDGDLHFAVVLKWGLEEWPLA